MKHHFILFCISLSLVAVIGCNAESERNPSSNPQNSGAEDSLALKQKINSNGNPVVEAVTQELTFTCSLFLGPYVSNIFDNTTVTTKPGDNYGESDILHDKDTLNEGLRIYISRYDDKVKVEARDGGDLLTTLTFKSNQVVDVENNFYMRMRNLNHDRAIRTLFCHSHL